MDGFTDSHRCPYLGRSQPFLVVFCNQKVRGALVRARSMKDLCKGKVYIFVFQFKFHRGGLSKKKTKSPAPTVLNEARREWSSLVKASLDE